LTLEITLIQLSEGLRLGGFGDFYDSLGDVNIFPASTMGNFDYFGYLAVFSIPFRASILRPTAYLAGRLLRRAYQIGSRYNVSDRDGPHCGSTE